VGHPEDRRERPERGSFGPEKGDYSSVKFGLCEKFNQFGAFRVTYI